MMPLSRRRFLGMAATVPLALPRRLTGAGPTPSLHWSSSHCLLLDTEEQCILQESLTGLARGLTAASIPFKQVAAGALSPARLIIVPGAVLNSPALAGTIRRLADRGSTVLYESGAAYAEPDALAAERHLLQDYFGLSLATPQELWPMKQQPSGPPYVRYHWPAQVMIRDFSRVLAVSGEAASSSRIAHIGVTSVACQCLIGKGSFIYLGSPLGPHLNFDDADAQRLLAAFVLSGVPSDPTKPGATQPIGS